MSATQPPRDVDKLVGDLLDAASAAADIVARGRDFWTPTGFCDSQARR
ncbi:MAG: hypothetical protein ACYCSX_11000 [Acidimicrobiales bacterium]